ncbi:MAG: glycine--tRNA ligase subunit beta [Sulfuricurvum sp. PD_MW2]|jgi:glycyl-tRNA synthetase beta chain|uniref:glycine--tRNA ligase subunit beta n=1 Tax=Sulfuricurvum sp. PD_MW2 TaxID=2027917 RepID=UPI000C065B12|nr:glycine--tRNA ligase subunit beta [Sulfuricurvum sp. PD_MW2]PHM16972.1 MAG: glycine--tRNA ligase subunit beta [Sulfuricurvum sp. PD_MW2]
MLKPLLIEIGVEELPAVPLLKELSEIEKKWVTVLEKNALVGEFEFYYTPRRLVLWHREFKTRQDDRVEEFYGAPVEIAIKDGVPTPAALGFAKKCGVEFDQLSHAEKGGKEVLYYSRTVEGRSSSEILGEMIDQWIKSLSFGKSMRWGSNQESFIRPIRWVNVTLGEELVDMELFGVRSSSETYVHRISHFEAKKVDSIQHYFELLKTGSVDLYPQSRRESILNAFATLEKEHGITIEVDENLLDEVVAITEHPTPLLGKFDENFLELPPEVIITSMKEHQRYFPVFKDGKLINAFVVVSNALCEDFSKVIEGNERVLRPRLSDALFFYRNDLKKGLSTAGLEKVVFMNGLGTLAEKIKREKVVASTIANLIYDNINPDHLDRAMEFAKADLMSEMVYEFTELQGLMGHYYALALGESAEVATAIKEQYLPSGEDSALPSTMLSAIVAMAMKVDTLIGMFSIGEIPTGSRDPFALRRAVNGIIKIAVAHQIPLNFSTLIDQLASLYPEGKEYKKNIETFIIERLGGAYVGINPSIIQSVVAKDSHVDLDILDIDSKIRAVAAIASSDSFIEAFSTFKRVSNILKDEAMDKGFNVDESLFENDAERTLFASARTAIEADYATLEERLDALFALKAPLDNFFDNVMVNAEDLSVRTNRKALVGMIYAEIYSIADIKNITL